LVVVGEAEEAGLRIVESVLVVHADVVLAALVRAYRDALLWKTHILFDVPDLKDPVLVQSVDTPRGLITHHIDDVVMLEGRAGPEVDWWEGPVGRDVILVELVL